MADMFDYLQWRGDLSFSQVYATPVDALIFSALAYIQFEDIVPEDVHNWVTLRQAAASLLSRADAKSRVRVESDLKLLRAAAETERFGWVGLSHYRSIFIPEADTQFAAITFLLEDGTAFLAFRGTDNTLEGWKEDFNMTFQESVPAQRLAQEYTERFAAASRAPMRLGGHSKGGNLAVYAGAKVPAMVQNRILAVYNQDGPGFTEQMVKDPGYLRIVPKVKTYVPQSSIFGMLLEHEEPHSIIRSKSVGLLQHDPYSWEVLGRDFVPVEALTADSRFWDRTFKTWLGGLSNEERSAFFDSVFDLLMLENASSPRDVLRPQNILAALKTMHLDEGRRKMITSVLQDLAASAKSTHMQKSREESPQ